MPVYHASDRSRRRRALESCQACGRPALPECLLCESPLIIRCDGLTECLACERHTFCICEVPA